MSNNKQATKVAIKIAAKPAVKPAAKVADPKPAVKVAAKVADTKPAVKGAVKPAAKVADTKPAAKVAKAATRKPLLSPTDFVVAEVNVSDKKRAVMLTEHLRDVHTVQGFLSTAKLSEVRELLLVEDGGKARADMLHRIIGRLGVLTNAFFKAKLKLTAPKLTKTKKAEADSLI